MRFAGCRPDGNGTGVDQAANTMPACGFQNVGVTDDVGARAGHRIGLAEWHLKCRQMNDGADAMLAHDGVQRPRVGDVAFVPGHPRGLGLTHQQAEPATLARQIEGDCRAAVA